MRLKITIVLSSLLLGMWASAPAVAAAFPEEGKRITMIVGSAAGGGGGLFYRLLTDHLEKQTGKNFEVIYRDGAGTQFALQAISTAKPDGYTMGQLALPTATMIWLDPTKQAQFKGDSFIPVSMVMFDPGATAVRADSPYKTLKDFIDAAKANPGKIKIGAGARNTRQHFDVLTLEKAAGVTFQKVHADSSAQPVTMLIGGQLDAVAESVGDFLNFVKSGQLRILGVWDDKRSTLAPEIPTMEEQGFKLYSGASRGIAIPAGSPKEAVEFWDNAVRKVTESAEFKDGMLKMGLPIKYMNNKDYTKLYADTEAMIKPIMASGN
jgi:tripartite-type tricarboxylate transporter receptor subunit TctC